jgi:ABC-type glycerol-3-phosphate transport system substrate-binding protein
MIFRKPLFFLLAVCLSTGMFLNCGKKSGAEGSSGPARVDVVFWHAMGGVAGDMLNALITEFNNAHPGIRVISQNMGSYNTLSQKLLASIVADNQPDIAQAYENWIARFVNGGLLVPFDGLITDRKTFYSDFFEIVQKDNLYDGKIMSLPFNKSTLVLYYNMDLFRRAGLIRPPQTWDEFRAMAGKLSFPADTNGKKSTVGYICGLNVSDFECFLSQAGGQLMSGDDSGKFVFNSDAGVEAVRLLLDMRFLDGSADYYPSYGTEYQNDFIGGRAAMMFASCPTRMYLVSRVSFNWNIAPILRYKKKAAIMYGTNIVLFAKASAAKRRAAWEFINWFISAPVQARWCAATGYIPVRRSCLKEPVMQEEIRKLPGLEGIINQVENGFYDPRTPDWYQGRQNLESVLSEILISRTIMAAYERYKKDATADPSHSPEFRITLDTTVNAVIRAGLDKAVKETEKWTQ